MLPENAFELKAEARSGDFGRAVLVMAFPFVAAIIKRIKHMPRHQVMRLGRHRRTLHRSAMSHRADLDNAIRGIRTHQRRHTDDVAADAAAEDAGHTALFFLGLIQPVAKL